MGNPLADVPPDEFVQARNALSRKLRDEGKADEARRVASLRRPSVPLWIVNQLGKRARRDVEELIASTRQARSAQVHRQSGDVLREAMRAQRDALHRLLGAAAETAKGIGVALTLEQERRVQDTLQTAATTAPDALTEGTLEQEFSAAGFETLLSGAPAPARSTAPVAAKAASRRHDFEARAEEQRRAIAEKRERILQQRNLHREEQASKRLSGRAEQMERLARQSQAAADSAKAKAEEARRAANEAAARLLALRQKS